MALMFMPVAPVSRFGEWPSQSSSSMSLHSVPLVSYDRVSNEDLRLFYYNNSGKYITILCAVGSLENADLK